MMNYMFNECEIDGIKTGVTVQKEIMEKRLLINKVEEKGKIWITINRRHF